MLEQIWSFLSSAENQNTITWIAGGLCVACGALWSVFKFFSTKKSSTQHTSKPGPGSDQFSITGNNNQIAGRDLKVGLNGCMVLVMIFIAALIILISLSRFGSRLVSYFSGLDNQIPAFEMTLSCAGGNPRFPEELTNVERNQLVEFASIGKEFSDKPIYFSLAIEKPCAACDCDRDSTEYDSTGRSSESYSKGTVYFGKDASNRQATMDGSVPSIWRNGVLFSASSPEDWSVQHNFYFPQYAHLDHEQYRKGAYGYYLAFEGLFIARSYGLTGGHVIHLDTMQPNSTQISRLKCIRDGKEHTLLNALLHGC